MRPAKRRMSTDIFHKSNNSLGPQTHCQLFELIRFDAFMVKYQDRYWIETKAEWTKVQQPDITQKAKFKKKQIISLQDLKYTHSQNLSADHYKPYTKQNTMIFTSSMNTDSIRIQDKK